MDKKLEKSIDVNEVPISYSGENINFTVWPAQNDIWVAKLHGHAILPTRKYPTDAGLDFFAYRDFYLPPAETKLLRTGIIVLIPETYFGLLKPCGINNWFVTAGVVDAGYVGEVIFKLFNPTANSIVIQAGAIIGQMVIIPIIAPPIREVSIEDIREEASERGEEGGIHESE